MQEKQGSQAPTDRKVILFMLVILVLLGGIIVWTLLSRADKNEETASTILLDSATSHATVDLMNFYENIDNGSSWLGLTESMGWPGDCLQEIPTVAGTQQVCAWFNDQASVVVTLLNDLVIAKTKVGF